jgi:hypothetical protein
MPWRIAMQAKLQTEDGKNRYKRHKQTVEPMFGIIKSAMGFVRFPLRGLVNVANEWLPRGTRLQLSKARNPPARDPTLLPQRFSLKPQPDRLL